MRPRFYAPKANVSGENILLPDYEGRHLSQVLRLKSGTEVALFNGNGHEFSGIVQDISGSSVVVKIDSQCLPPAPEPSLAITLASAVLKSHSMDNVVKYATLFGVSAIQPVISTRSDVSLSALQQGKRMERWKRIAVSAAKQCGGALIPSIFAPCNFNELSENLVKVLSSESPQLMLVEPSASCDCLSISELERPDNQEAALIIGPEGGWTTEEVEGGSTIFKLVTLGSRTFRAEVAPAVALASLFTAWKEF
jgi:16S rRNA (uracil1498-N3)-methyltransferase